MTDDSSGKPDNQDPAAILEWWRQRIRSGQPMEFREIDAPMKVMQDTEGGLLIDCPTFRLMGIEEAGIVRFRIAPTAMRNLFQVLTDIQNTQGMPEPIGTSRSVQ